MISVIIVEDDEDMLFALTAIISHAPDMILAGSAINGKQGINAIKDIMPDIVLMDIGLPDIDGIECVQQLKPLLPNTEFIMCTAIDTDEKVFESIKAGASSYMLKNVSSAEMYETIREVSNGRSPMNGDIARKMINVLQRKSIKQDFGITNKENEILNLLAKGHTYQEIADLVHITVKTLKSHIYRMYIKLQVDNRTEAINKYFG